MFNYLHFRPPSMDYLDAVDEETRFMITDLIEYFRQTTYRSVLDCLIREYGVGPRSHDEEVALWDRAEEVADRLAPSGEDLPESAARRISHATSLSPREVLADLEIRLYFVMQNMALEALADLTGATRSGRCRVIVRLTRSSIRVQRIIPERLYDRCHP